MDETYIKLKAKWDYLYRAVDKSGSNEAALILLSFYLMLLGLWPHVWIEDRQIKYLNNQIEQDHRFIKKRVKPMIGFKFRKSLESTIAGYELVHMLRKGQCENAGNMSVFEQFYALAA